MSTIEISKIFFFKIKYMNLAQKNFKKKISIVLIPDFNFYKHIYHKIFTIILSNLIFDCVLCIGTLRLRCIVRR